MREAAVRHRFDHHVHIAAVIQVPVADHDRVKGCEIDLALRVLNDCARARVEADSSVALLDEQSTGRCDLLGHHEPGAGGPHERQPHVSATSDRGTSDLSPKYRS